MTFPKPLVLASASPRRSELLRQVGAAFVVRPSAAEETAEAPDHPEEQARVLALVKAEDIARGEDNAIVLGADTIVVLENRVLGKPADDGDALAMLRALRGRTHQVITGVAVLDVVDGRVARMDVRHVSTDVTMRPAADEELRAYVASGEPRDKAGAYAIQGLGALLVERIDGDYFNVVGLPLFTVAAMLAPWGARPFTGPATRPARSGPA